MLKIAPALLLALAVSSVAHAQMPAPNKMDSAKEADIRKLLQMTGAAAIGQQVVQQTLAQLRTSIPNVPDSFWNDFSSRLKAEELVDLVVPIYDRHLSHDDIKATVKYYETPAGQHFIAALPAITQESMTVGGEWGRKIAERVVDELKKQQQQQQKPPKKK